MIFKEINIKELFQLMQEHDIAETRLQNGKATVVVKRNKEPVIMNTAAVPFQSHEAASVLNIGGVEAGRKPESIDKSNEVENTTIENYPGAGEETDDYHTILSPLVGTFYEAPAPDAIPFIEVGDQVDVGDVVCIVEAMKSMNEIQSDVKGVVKEICVENAQLVEFEHPLFKIDTGN